MDHSELWENSYRSFFYRNEIWLCSYFSMWVWRTQPFISFFFKVNCALEYYKTEEKSVVVLPWRLNIDSQTEIRTEGLFAALNDCLYRNMNDFRYLMLIDFDEFIVPHTNDTLPQMLAHVDAQKIIVTGNIGRYVFTLLFYQIEP